MDFQAVRDALRTARERARLTLDQAAAQSGLNRATIHSLENVRREPNLRPDLGTIEKLVTTYGLTVGSFFVEVEQPAEAAPRLEDVLKAVDDLSRKLDRLSDQLAAATDVASVGPGGGDRKLA